MSWTALYLKEMREQVRPSGKWSGMFIMASIMSILFGGGATVFVGIMQYKAGEFLPIPESWPLALLPALAGLAGTSFGATLLPMNAGIDSIAGERERHTLETLLAGPLGDRAIVWAKASSIATVASLTGVLGGIAIAIALPILYATQGILWALLVLPASLLLPAVPSFMTACTAIVMSMRAKTVKDAGQRLSIVMMPVFLMPAIVIFAATDPVIAIVIVSIAVVLMGLISIAMPILAFVLFRRNRLIVA